MTNFIELEQNKGILTVWLNRPDKKNALNDEMILALQDLADNLKDDTTVDIVILKGRGDIFCAGADFCWFKKAADLPEEERVASLKILSVLMRTWSRLPQTTITVGHGYMYGGALGLLAVSDFVILEQTSHLRLSEVLIGIYPATIAPYLIKRMGFKRSKALMLSAEPFNAQLALAYGLADKIAPADRMAEIEDQLIKNLQKSDASTRRALKQYMFEIVNKPINDDLTDFSAQSLSNILDSEIAREFIYGFSKQNNTNCG